MERQIQEQILGAEHQRGHRLDLGRSRPLPEVCDRNAPRAMQPVGGDTRTEDVMAYVEQSQSLGVQRGLPKVRLTRSCWHISQGMQDRLDPVHIAPMNQQIDVSHRSQCRKGIDECRQSRPFQNDNRNARLGEPQRAVRSNSRRATP